MVSCFFVVFLSYDIFLTLYHELVPGPWLKVGGMMVAANAAKKMASLDGSIGGVSSEAGKTAKYLMRSVGKEGVEPGKDETVWKGGGFIHLSDKKLYG